MKETYGTIPKPLEGIKVIELANYVAAPIVGRICADMGAEVIKIEGRGGDAWRATSLSHTRTSASENPLFDVFNVGKKSITLNIKSESGKKILFELLENADILITNTRNQSLVKLGIDYESIKEQFPRLIYATLTGYGYWIRGRKMVDEHSLTEFNHVSYYLFISVNLFFSIYQSDLSAAANWRLVGFCIIGVILECIVGMLFIPCIESDSASAGAMMQSMFRTNLVLVGLPIAAGLYENELGAISIVTAILVPFYNVLGVFFLERYRSGSASVRKIAKGIITNPLVIAAVLGILFSINGWKLPYAAEKTVRYFSQGCTAVALFILGASLNFGAPGNSHSQHSICAGRATLCARVTQEIEQAMSKGRNAISNQKEERYERSWN